MTHRTLFLLAIFSLFAAVVFVYVPGLTGPMVFDDLTNIVFVPKVRITELTYQTLLGAATAVPQGPLGRPLAFVTFALNHYFTGIDPYYFKLTNLFIHLTAGGLIFVLTRRLLAKQPDILFSPRRQAWVALFAFAIWALHPLNLTSVLYVVQRMTSLASLLTVAGLLGYALGRQQLIRGTRWGFLTIILSLVVFGGLATLVKENGVLIIAYALAIELAFFRLTVSHDLTKPGRWFLMALFALPIAAAIVMLIISFDTLAGTSAYASRQFALDERLLTQARALWFYIGLVVLPDTMSLGLYHDDFVISRSLFTPPSTFAAVFGIVTLCGLAIAAIRRAAMLSFAIMWFLAGHAIESTVIPLELVHEHRNYLPSFGIVLAMVYYVLHPNTDRLIKPGLRYAALAIYCLLIGAATFSRSTHWASEWTLYTKEVLNHPNSSRAHSMLGILFHDNKIYHEAQQQFTIAAQLDRSSAEPVIQLAHHQYIAKGRIDSHVLEELEDRLMHLPLNVVTLWTLEPLIRITQKDERLNRHLLSIYIATMQRSDINISSDWRGSAAGTIASAYRAHGDISLAAKFFALAFHHRPLPAYALSLAELELQRGRKDAAAKALASVNQASLTTEQKQHFEVLNRQFGVRGGSR